MERDIVKIRVLVEDLHLNQISGNDEALERWVITADVNRPGLELSGYIDEREKKRVIILGNKELGYIDTLSEELQFKRFEALTDSYTPCIIISSNRPCPINLLTVAKQKNFPIFLSDKSSSQLMIDLIGCLERHLAPKDHVHGVLLNIYGRGVLIEGVSGVGKSEIALELIKKGHILIADDLVDVCRIQNKLRGMAPPILYGMLEVRGIGIIDAIKMFGAWSVMPEAQIDFIIHLEKWDYSKSHERSFIDEDVSDEVLGVQVPAINIPVREGRSMAIIIEAAVINYNLKLMGIDSNQAFDSRVKEFIMKRG
jgi:HPr kinase/phosphorylase